MKKYFLLLPVLSLSLLTHAAVAQYSSSWLGVRAGVNFANESVDVPDGASTGFKFGPLGGIIFDHFFDENWGISASLLYDAKGIHENYGAASQARIDPNDPSIVYSG